ncbi:MAG: hypothetical protein DRP56_09995 [Planctomycetota bacterium]|nr:MAG: hypothetical protein DRP56_09995 [Planctomycetota bacterium]
MDPNTIPEIVNNVSSYNIASTQTNTLLTVVLGLFVAWVAFQQYKLSRAKFKLDLFEKRYVVYKATQKLLTHVLQKGDVDLDELFEFRGKTQDAIFLFDKKIPEYLNDIDGKVLKLNTLRDQLEGIPKSDIRSELCGNMKQLLLSITKELPKLKVVFGKYMNFKEWK